MIIRTPGIKLLFHLRWPVREGGEGLTPEALDRLAPYTTRYAQTLGVLVHAVGGVEDHLHVVLDAAPTRSLDEINNELRRATSRFLRDVLNARDFAWADEGQYLASISPGDLDEIAAYVREQPARHAGSDLRPALEGEDAGNDAPDDEMPGWLRDVLPRA